MRPNPKLAIAIVLILSAGSTLRGAGAASPTAGCAQEATAAVTAVKALLAAQSAAWTRGDLEAFTAVYAEDASFLGTSGLTHGRQQVLERYRRRYPDKKAMGTLSLEVIETRPVAAEGPACAVNGFSLVARWKLAYPDQPDKKTAEGLTLLVLQRHGDRWEIVEDASM